MNYIKNKYTENKLSTKLKSHSLLKFQQNNWKIQIDK